jgi:hypothetical protein
LRQETIKLLDKAQTACFNLGVGQRVELSMDLTVSPGVGLI